MDADILTQVIIPARQRMTKAEARRILLSISPSNERSSWAPGLTITEVINGMQDILDEDESSALDEKNRDHINDIINDRDKENDRPAPSTGASTSSDIPE